MIASLPMYDLPDCRQANDRYWAGIRDGLRGTGLAAPDAFTRGMPDFMAHWLRPDLVLSQTCGYPFRAVLAGKVTLIGTPDFGLDGCPPGYYQSVFVVRRDDARDGLMAFKDAGFAYNEAMSQSGWAAPQTYAAGLGFRFRPAVQTGGHALSARAVLEGRADIAALDAMTWRLLQRNDASMAGLRVEGRTEPTPGLPYIAALGAKHRVVFDAVAGAIAGLDTADRETLGIRRILYIPAAAYLAVPTPAPPDGVLRSAQ
jgi:hypothetical protein